MPIPRWYNVGTQSAGPSVRVRPCCDSRRPTAPQPLAPCILVRPMRAHRWLAGNIAHPGLHRLRRSGVRRPPLLSDRGAALGRGAEADLPVASRQPLSRHNASSRCCVPSSAHASERRRRSSRAGGEPRHSSPDFRSTATCTVQPFVRRLPSVSRIS